MCPQMAELPLLWLVCLFLFFHRPFLLHPNLSSFAVSVVSAQSSIPPGEDSSAPSDLSAEGSPPVPGTSSSVSINKEASATEVDSLANKIGEAVISQLQGGFLKSEEREGSREGKERAKKGRILVAIKDLSHAPVSEEDSSHARKEEGLGERWARWRDLEGFLRSSKDVASATGEEDASARSSSRTASGSSGIGDDRSASLSSMNKNLQYNSPKQVVRAYQVLDNVGIVIVDFHPSVSSSEVADTVRTLWFEHPDVWLIEADTEVHFRGWDSESQAMEEERTEKAEEKVEEVADGMRRQRAAAPRETISPNDSLFPQQWALNNNNSPSVDVRAVGAWSLVYDAQGNRRASLPDKARNGAGMLMAHIDTGADVNHPDLKDNVWRNPNEIPGNGIDDDDNGYVDDVNGWNFDGDNNDVTDEHGHGTHTAGLLGATANNNQGVAGVFWDAKIVVLKFKNDVSDAVRAIEYCLAMGIRVSTNSWGFNTPVEILRLVLDRANKMKHMFVCAVDNKGRDNTWFNDFPPNYAFPNMIRVASITSHADLDVTSDFSKTKVDIAAPGKRLVSTVPNAIYGRLYGFKDGTSMATPLVAGLSGLLLSLDPSLDIYQVRDIIFNTVTPLTAIQNRIRTGGIINCENAVKTVLGISVTPATAVSVLPSSRAPLDLFGGAGQVSELLFAGFNDFMSGLLTRYIRAVIPVDVNSDDPKTNPTTEAAAPIGAAQ